MPQAIPGTLGRPQRGRLRGFVASAARCCNALTALTSESPFLLRRVSCPRQESKQQKWNLHVTHVLKTATTLTSFDIRISRNNCCLSSAIMGWSAPLPAFQTQTFWYTWYALPLCRVWSGRGTVVYWWNIIYLRSSLCTVWHSQPPRTGEVCREHDLLYVSFLFKFQAFWRIFWLGRLLKLASAGGWARPCLEAKLRKIMRLWSTKPNSQAWPKSRHTRGQKQGMGSVKPEWKWWAFHQVGLGCSMGNLCWTQNPFWCSHLHPNNIFYMSLHPQTHFPCCL